MILFSHLTPVSPYFWVAEWLQGFPPRASNTWCNVHVMLWSKKERDRQRHYYYYSLGLSCNPGALKCGQHGVPQGWDWFMMGEDCGCGAVLRSAAAANHHRLTSCLENVVRLLCTQRTLWKCNVTYSVDSSPWGFKLLQTETSPDGWTSRRLFLFSWSQNLRISLVSFVLCKNI